MSAEAIKRDYLDNLFYIQGRFAALASLNDQYMALAYTARDRLLRRWVPAGEVFLKRKARTVVYLSAEFLLGPHLDNNLMSLGIWEETRQAMQELGLDLDRLLEQEQEPGLGSGGLGRLAACFMDSLATLEIPAIGYGIRYEFGIFDQAIHDGWQVERTDKWLHLGNPWEIARPEIAFEVKLGGHTESATDASGRYRVRWIADKVVKGVAHDTPILGYRSANANFLRLWKAEACESFDFQSFNVGDYYGAVYSKVDSEIISKVLYPNDEPQAGKSLRLAQQYFLVSCSAQDMLRIMFQADRDPARFPDKYAVQLNDTHPALAVAELMRLLVDEHEMAWDSAWELTQRSFAYTNHTLLPEALETWPLDLFGKLLPRHLEIVYEINRRFLDEVRRRYPGDEDRVRRLSLIDEHGERYVRMAHLACVGSHSINGVSQLHSELLKRGVLRDFYELTPEKFSSKTNGVTPRRFMWLSNRPLAALISARIGEGWITRLEELRRLEALADDAGFREEWRRVKRLAKHRLTLEIERRIGVKVAPDSLFDIQAKRIHEYKRQHLNVLSVIALYNRIRRDPDGEHTPRTVIFAGKAAPGYRMAKLIIKLIHSVAEVVNSDPAVGERLRVVFLPGFNVKQGEIIYPAADLSQQISTAGKEACGTGNMKFAMNGALTIGTLDGANPEIRDEVGADNFFLFGLTAEEVMHAQQQGYRPWEIYQRDAELREALDQIASGHFSRGDAGLFKPLVDGLLYRDDYLVLADYRAYADCREQAARIYRDGERWTRMSILNVARIGKFSSDRAIREYCEEIWNVAPAHVELDGR